MTETDLLLTAAKYAAYLCASCTALLWFVPNPEKAKEILILKSIPLWYARFYNILRYFSGNQGWKIGRVNGNGKPESKNP